MFQNTGKILKTAVVKLVEFQSRKMRKTKNKDANTSTGLFLII
jgi:hypothetical protein